MLIVLVACGQHNSEYYGHKNSVEINTITPEDSQESKIAEAIHANEIDVLSKMMQEGVDMNNVLANGNPPLIEAILWDKLDVVKLFLDNGVRRECFDINGISAQEFSKEASEEIYNIFN